MARPSGRPTTGVFIAWDDEDVSVERRDAGTVHDRTVVTARRTIVRQALWSNDVTPETIASAEAYAASIVDQHDRVRVMVFDGKNGNRRA